MKTIFSMLITLNISNKKEVKTSRLPHLLDNRLTVGGKVVNLTSCPPFTPQEDSWYSFTHINL
jgi:hypothetical protein